MHLHHLLKSCEHTQGRLPAVTLTPGEPGPLCSMSPRPRPAQARACLQPHLRSPGVMICLLLEEGKEPGGETKPLKCFSDERLLQDKRGADLRPCHRCYSVFVENQFLSFMLTSHLGTEVPCWPTGKHSGYLQGPRVGWAQMPRRLCKHSLTLQGDVSYWYKRFRGPLSPHRPPELTLLSVLLISLLGLYSSLPPDVCNYKWCFDTLICCNFNTCYLQSRKKCSVDVVCWVNSNIYDEELTASLKFVPVPV